MCKAQQSYLPYLTAASNGTLPLNLLITPCAGYLLACRSACASRGFPETEPTLFEVSHCPIFKLVPVFVSQREFVVLDFASLPKVDSVGNGRAVRNGSKGSMGGRSYANTKSSIDHSGSRERLKSKHIEILNARNSGECVDSPSSLISSLTTMAGARNGSLVSPITPAMPTAKLVKTPMTPRTIGAGMMSPRGGGNVAMSPLRIACATGKAQKSSGLVSAAPRLEKLDEEDEEWQKLRNNWRKECDVAPKEVLRNSEGSESGHWAGRQKLNNVISI